MTAVPSAMSGTSAATTASVVSASNPKKLGTQKLRAPISAASSRARSNIGEGAPVHRHVHDADPHDHRLHVIPAATCDRAPAFGSTTLRR